MKNKQKYFHVKYIDVPLYVGKFVLVVSNDSRQVNKLIPLIGKKETMYGSTIRGSFKTEHTIGKEFAIFMVLNFHNKHRKVDHATVAHEAVHVARFITEKVGINGGYGDDESLAYLVGWVTKQVYSWLYELEFEVSLNHLRK